jgi:hypothetical protein
VGIWFEGDTSVGNAPPFNLVIIGIVFFVEIIPGELEGGDPLNNTTHEKTDYCDALATSSPRSLLATASRGLFP